MDVDIQSCLQSPDNCNFVLQFEMNYFGRGSGNNMILTTGAEDGVSTDLKVKVNVKVNETVLLYFIEVLLRHCYSSGSISIKYI